MRALGIFDDPAIVIGLASALSEFHGEMTAFDKSANDLLNPALGHATLRGEPGNAGPGVSPLCIDEVCEHIGEEEGERRQLRIGAQLIEPTKFFAMKRNGVVTWHLLFAVRVMRIAKLLRLPFWRMRGRTIFDHAAKIGRVARDQNGGNRLLRLWRVSSRKDWRSAILARELVSNAIVARCSPHN